MKRTLAAAVGIGLAAYLAWWVVGGLTGSTLVTLVLVPVVYSVFAGPRGATEGTSRLPTVS